MVQRHGLGIPERSHEIHPQLSVCTDNYDSHRAKLAGGRKASIVKGLEDFDIIIDRIIEILKFVDILNQLLHNRVDVVRRLKAENIPCLLGAHLIISDILKMLDRQPDLELSMLRKS